MFAIFFLAISCANHPIKWATFFKPRDVAMGTGALFRVALKKMQVYLQHQWTGWMESLDWFCWENLQETPWVFTIKYRKPWFLPSNIGLSCKFSHHPILWWKIETWNHHISWETTMENPMGSGLRRLTLQPTHWNQWFCQEENPDVIWLKATTMVELHGFHHGITSLWKVHGLAMGNLFVVFLGIVRGIDHLWMGHLPGYVWL